MNKTNIIWKSYLIYLLILACTALASSQTAALAGDVNLDNQVNIVDALMIAQYYAGLNPSGFDPQPADVNQNGTVDIVDALLVAQYYVGLIPSLPLGGGFTVTPSPTPFYSIEYFSRLVDDTATESGANVARIHV